MRYDNELGKGDRLIALGLVKRLDDGTVRVPFDEIDIRIVHTQQAPIAQKEITAVAA